MTAPQFVLSRSRFQALRAGALAILLLAAPALCAQAPAAAPSAKPTLERVRESGEIRIGVRPTGFPFSFIDDKKQARGYAVDLCQKVVERVQREVRTALRVNYVPVSAAERFDALADGRIDIECATTTNTEERRKRAEFGPTYFVTTVGFMTRAGAPYREFNDFHGKRVIAVKGTTAETALKRYAELYGYSITLVAAADGPDALKRLEAGEGVAYAHDDILLQGVKGKAREPGAWQIITRFLTYDPIAAMYRKDDPGFARVVNQAFSDQFFDGSARKAYERWFLAAPLNVPLGSLQAENFRTPNARSAWSM